MRFSVVINTYNRAASLRQTLDSLRRQTYPDFEVVIVNGPSTDDTAQVLADYAGQVRVYRCPQVQLSISRNIGVNAAAGDVVAFIDDDSIATPRWLEELAAAYDSPRVGGVGGVVYDPTGVALQYRYAACHRDGRVLLWAEPPLDDYLTPGADPVGYLQGTNMSFARAVLQEIGGFDENIRYCYDDVETCLRVIDRGYTLKPLAGAAVHHKFLASPIRSAQKATLDPYNQLCDRIHFVLSNAGSGYTSQQRLDSIMGEAKVLRYYAEQNVARGAMTAAQRAYHDERVDEALAAGLGGGLAVGRKGVVVAAAERSAFVAFPTLTPAQGRLKLCFISDDYPPGDFGGTGRCTHELAAGFAGFGHEVHVITESRGGHRIDLEDGVWVHRIPEPDRFSPELDWVPVKKHLYFMAAAYHEVCRIHAEAPVDLVSATLWQSEGMVCGFDPRFPTTTTLITAMKAITGLAEWTHNVHCQQMVALEDELVTRSHYLHAVSRPILERAIQDYQADPAKAFVANLGLRDRAPAFPRRRPNDGKVRVLYVGRLETRKGVDLILEIIPALCREFPDVEFVLAGKDVATDEKDNHRKRFLAKHARNRPLLDRVQFTGLVTEDQLYQHYADADVVCIPSRYESFGLVFVEAMIFGKPVIGSRAGGMTEVVADGEQGYLIPPGDASALADCLRKLVSDPQLRARFGRRSRELYEQRFSVPVMVAGCEAAFRKTIAAHKATIGTDPTAPVPRELVARELADVMVKASKVPPDWASAGAARLLDPVYHPVDFVQQFRKHWGAPADEFIRAAVKLLFARETSAEEIADIRMQVANADDKVSVVRLLLGRWEARKWGHSDAWLPQLEATRHFAPPPVSFRQRLRRKLARMQGVGRLLKFSRRAIHLPVNFHKLYESFLVINQLARQAAERQARTDELTRWTLESQGTTEKLLQDLLAGQAQTRELTDEQSERMTLVFHALTEVADIVEFPRHRGDGDQKRVG